MKNILASDLDYILQHTLPLWSELREKRIFITGGTGFIGTWLLESLVWANDKYQLNLIIVVLTRDKHKHAAKVPHLAKHSIITFHQGDVRDFDFPQDQFDYVIHAATDPSLNDQQIILDTIIQGTKHTLAFATAAHVKKFLFLSSGAVYGKQPADLSHLDENYNGSPELSNPAATYGLSKRVAEHLCMLHAKQSPIEIKIARCFAFVGPYLPLNAHFAIGNFIGDRLANKTIFINGDGSPYRSYQYATDLIIWLLHILCRGESSVPYNVGSDEAISILELATLIAKNFSPYLDIQIAQATSVTPKHLAERYVPSTKRTIDTFGLTTKIPLKNAIEKTLHWHQAPQG